MSCPSNCVELASISPLLCACISQYELNKDIKHFTPTAPAFSFIFCVICFSLNLSALNWYSHSYGADELYYSPAVYSGIAAISFFILIPRYLGAGQVIFCTVY